MFCKKCGYTLKENQTECPFCGFRVGDELVKKENMVNNININQGKENSYTSVSKETKDEFRNQLGYVDLHSNPIMHLLLCLIGYGAMEIICVLIVNIAIRIISTNGSDLSCLVAGFESCSQVIQDEITLISTITQVIIELLIVTSFAIIFRKNIKDFFKEFKMSKTYKWFGLGIGAAYSCTFVYSLILEALGKTATSTNQGSVTNIIISNPFLGFLFVVVAAPLFEEVVFRLGLFRTFTFKNKKTEFLGLIVTTFAFASIHLVSTFVEVFADPANPDLALLENDLWSLPAYLIGAYFITWSYKKSNNFATNVLFHMSWNLMSYLAIMLTKDLPDVEKISQVIINLCL